MLIDYAKSLAIQNEESTKWVNRIQRINNKLSEKYYDEDTDGTIIVGSVGRLTAITKTSDYDVLYVLPSAVFTRFDNYDSNGQSALLQEIKEVIKETYPNTQVRGDGQVVDVTFGDGVVEVVPAFEQSDGSFKYPDSNDGGKWKITKPTQEIAAAVSAKDGSLEVYSYLCYLARKWKNHTGFAFKGLLIDTLVLDYLNSDSTYPEKSETELLKGLYAYLAAEDKERSYWLALGSNQQISNDDNGKFVYKANQALKKFTDDVNLSSAMQALFGYKETENRALQEEFAEEKFTIDVQYNMTLDCEITQEGYVMKRLSEYLMSKLKIKGNKTLRFRMVNNNIPDDLPVSYWWKVRNLGPESKGRERGKIFEGSKSQVEHSSFNGKHYVECFAVAEDTIIARARIDVPIDLTNGL
jgi:hypothetical protein